MRVPAIAFAAVSVWGQTYHLQPDSLRQGDVIHVTSSVATSARIDDRTIRLFPQPDGLRLGLLPIPATSKTGRFRAEFLDERSKVLHTAEVSVRDAQFPKQNIQLSSAISALKPAPEELETVAKLRTTVSDFRYWSEPFAKPVPGCLVSPFGVRRFHNGKPTGNYHGGFDLRGAEGVPVHAMAGGVVRIVRAFNIHGNTVGVDHGQGLTSLYLHLSRFGTTEGAKVAKGDVIGYVGTTGRSTAPHLHWTVNVHGVAVNPGQFAAAEPCKDVVRGRKPRGSRRSGR